MQLHSIAAALLFAFTACVVEEADESTTEQAVLSGWTPFTSEEYPPIVCDGQSLPREVNITGPYADNIRWYCQQDSRIVRGDSYWTSYFSEEYRGMMYCNNGYWVTGLACQGRYCDNLSLQCTRILNSYPTLVTGTVAVSEEQGWLSFLGGKYPLGVTCLGPYCDELRFATGYLNVTVPEYPDRVE
jgi:hypothetical protein